MLSSHFPSAFNFRLEPSIAHLTKLPYGIGSFCFQLTPTELSEIAPNGTDAPDVNSRSASARMRGFTCASTMRIASSTVSGCSQGMKWL